MWATSPDSARSFPIPLAVLATTLSYGVLMLLLWLTSFTASGFVGKWTFKDISGEPFTIWLSDDGTAKGDRSGEGLSGMWKPRGNAAMVTWDCGSVIKIAKEGDSYKVHQE
jgi:hypothetical protein